MSLIRNDAVRRHILDPANCHCTYREMLPNSKTKAIARCNDSNEERASISWTHKKKETVIFWHLPIGVSFCREFLADATDEKIDEVITDGFVEMDAAWRTEEE